MRRHAKASPAGTTWRQALGLARILRGAIANADASLPGKGSGGLSHPPVKEHRNGRVAAAALAAAALALLLLAPSAMAAKIPGGPPVAIFGPDFGSCASGALATGKGDFDFGEGKGDLSGAVGTSKREQGSPVLTDVNVTSGKFEVGQVITGTGVPSNATIIAVTADTITMDKNAPAGGIAFPRAGKYEVANVTTTAGEFAVGQGISGSGILQGTTITAVGAGTLTISQLPTAGGTATALYAATKEVTNVSTNCGEFLVGQSIAGGTANPPNSIPPATTITAVGAGTLTLSKPPTSGTTGAALSAVSVFANVGHPNGLAVNEVAHRLFALDYTADKVHAFNSPGLTGSIAGFPLSVPAGPFTASAIAVDNSAEPSAGRLYFADSSTHKIYAFQPDGTELNIGNGFPNFPITVPGEGSSIPTLCGAAVDSAGNLWIGDQTHYGPSGPSSHIQIRRFSPSGVPLDSVRPILGDRSSCGLAFDSEDNLYVSGNINQGGQVWRYTTASGYDPLLATRVGSGTSVAVDKGRDLTYTAVNSGGAPRVEVGSTGGDLLGEFADELSTPSLQSVTVDEAAERVYISDASSKRIYAFGFVKTPDVTTGAAFGADSTHETLRGTVNPLSIAVSDCHFEYTPESDFELFGFGHAVSAPCASTPGSGSSPVDVSADLSGLPPATRYRVRLIAGNANGRTIGATRTFTTLGPVISGEKASDVTSTTATLEAQVNPNGEGTAYRFQYVGKADFEQSGWAKATSVPAGVVGVGSGHGDVLASHPIAGLSPGATYHFRAVATNASATLAGRGSALTTLVHDGTSCANAALRSGTSAHLPDCRAYEQVSPVDKGGFDIDPRWAVISSPDGIDVAYASTGGFGDSKVAGLPVSYAARRTDAWRTEGISPPKDPVNDLFLGTVYGASADFSKQLVASNAKLTPEATEDDLHLYVHDSADDSYEYVATIPINRTSIGPVVSAMDEVTFRGASADGSRFYFSTQGEGATGGGNHFSLPSVPAPPVTAKNNLYEFSGGQLKLVGILPDDVTVAPAGAVAPGLGQLSERGPSALDSHPVSDDGAVYWTDGSSLGSGTLYRREGGHSTLVASDARWWGATPDGSHAFYQVGNGNLQRYDAATQTSIDTGVSVLNEPSAKGVLGISDDGEYAYLLSHGAHAPGAFPTGTDDANLYVWHDGEARLIARVIEADNFFKSGTPADWRVSANGRYLGLLTGDQMHGNGFSFGRMPVNPESNETYVRAFLYDYEADSFVCASCTAGEGAPSADVRFKHGPPNFNAFTFKQQTGGASRNVSNAGQLFFNTVKPLVAGDTNEKYDVYEYQAGALHLISSGQSNDDSWFGDATPSGDDVFFLTREGLVGQDVDPNVDLYVAKVNGGLIAQAAGAQGAVCQDAEQCHGAPTAAPSEAGPGSSAFEAPPQGAVKRRRDCSPAGSEARKLGQRAKRLRRAARKATDAAAAMQMRHEARRLGKRARKAARQAKRCRRANRRVAR